VLLHGLEILGDGWQTEFLRVGEVLEAVVECLAILSNVFDFGLCLEGIFLCSSICLEAGLVDLQLVVDMVLMKLHIAEEMFVLLTQFLHMHLQVMMKDVGCLYPRRTVVILSFN
jgi:hypothetical protein